MLGKLLKYEVPALGRKLVPLYIAWAAAAVFLGLMIGPLQEKSEFMIVISALLYTGVATAIFVMAIVLIIQRYKNSLLGEEAYFNMVLPVSTSQHIANKLISALIWVFLTGVAAVITALIIGLFGGAFFEFIHINWKMVFQYINGNDVLLFLELLIAILVSSGKTVMQIYAAITIGHQAKSHTTLASIGAYIGILIFESMIGRLFIAIAPAFSNLTSQMSEDAQFQTIMIPAILVGVVLIAVYFLVCKVLMEKRLNLS